MTYYYYRYFLPAHRYSQPPMAAPPSVCSLVQQGEAMQRLRKKSDEQDAMIAGVRQSLDQHEVMLKQFQSALREQTATQDMSAVAANVLQGLRQKLDGQGVTVASLHKSLDQHEVMLKQFQRALREQTATRDISAVAASSERRAAQLAEHGRELERHGRMLRLQADTTAQIHEQITTLTMVTCGIGALLAIVVVVSVVRRRKPAKPSSEEPTAEDPLSALRAQIGNGT